MSKQLLTVGKLAEMTRLPVHKVQYVLRSREIHEVQRAGNARVFSAGTVDAIREAVQGMEARKGNCAPPS